MSEDTGRRGAEQAPLRQGSAGPADPHADPATEQLARPDRDPEPPTEPVAQDRPGAAERSRAAALWVGLILSAIVLIFLLVFILQNGDLVTINFLGWTGELPTGVALLLAAVAGLLLVAIPGSARILQLRRAARRAGR